MDRLRIAALLLTALGLTAGTSYAQGPTTERQTIDRVVAVVGDSAILQTDIDEEVFRILASTGESEMPSDPAVRQQLYSSALDARVNELLILTAAARDSISVGDDEVERQVEEQILQQTRAFGGEAAFTEALRAQGFTLTGYRHELTRQVRNRGIVERYMATIRRDRRPPPLTEKDVRKFFEEQKDNLGERPATVTFEMVVVPPKPSESARTAAREEAERILQLIRDGEDFAELAGRYSQDPGSRERGGDLGWFRENQMVKEFATVAFSLPPGSVSGVVESPFGFHIIKVEKTKGAERQARHILIVPEFTPGDGERARETAGEVLDKLRAGESVDALINEFGDPNDRDQGKVGPFPKDRLPPPFNEHLANAQSGDLVGPFPIPGPRGDRWAVVRVTDVTERGPYSWDDPIVRQQFRQQLEEQLLLEEVISELKARTYIDIRL